MNTKRVTVLRPQSNIIISDDGTVTEFDCVHCVHCQMVMRVGENRDQCFCYKCMGPTCHKMGCRTACIPLEKRLLGEMRFAGRV